MGHRTRPATRARAARLGVFFKDLKRRARPPRRPQRGEPPTPEQKLYIDAWKQCREAGLDVNGPARSRSRPRTRARRSRTRWPATAARWAPGALKTYQLVAAMDWSTPSAAPSSAPGPAAPAGSATIQRARKGNRHADEDVGGVKYTFPLAAPDRPPPSATSCAPARAPRWRSRSASTARTTSRRRCGWRWARPRRSQGRRRGAAGQAIAASGRRGEPAAGEEATRPRPRRSRRRVVASAAKADFEALQTPDLAAAQTLDAAAERSSRTSSSAGRSCSTRPPTPGGSSREQRFATVEAIFD